MKFIAEKNSNKGAGHYAVWSEPEEGEGYRDCIACITSEKFAYPRTVAEAIAETLTRVTANDPDTEPLFTHPNHDAIIANVSGKCLIDETDVAIDEFNQHKVISLELRFGDIVDLEIRQWLTELVGDPEIDRLQFDASVDTIPADPSVGIMADRYEMLDFRYSDNLAFSTHTLNEITEMVSAIIEGMVVNQVVEVEEEEIPRVD